MWCHVCIIAQECHCQVQAETLLHKLNINRENNVLNYLITSFEEDFSHEDLVTDFFQIHRNIYALIFTKTRNRIVAVHYNHLVTCW